MIENNGMYQGYTVEGSADSKHYIKHLYNVCLYMSVQEKDVYIEK